MRLRVVVEIDDADKDLWVPGALHETETVYFDDVPGAYGFFRSEVISVEVGDD